MQRRSRLRAGGLMIRVPWALKSSLLFMPYLPRPFKVDENLRVPNWWVFRTTLDIDYKAQTGNGGDLY